MWGNNLYFITDCSILLLRQDSCWLFPVLLDAVINAGLKLKNKPELMLDHRRM